MLSAFQKEDIKMDRTGYLGKYEHSILILPYQIGLNGHGHWPLTFIESFKFPNTEHFYIIWVFESIFLL